MADVSGTTTQAVEFTISPVAILGLISSSNITVAMTATAQEVMQRPLATDYADSDIYLYLSLASLDADVPVTQLGGGTTGGIGGGTVVSSDGKVTVQWNSASFIMVAPTIEDDGRVS